MLCLITVGICDWAVRWIVGGLNPGIVSLGCGPIPDGTCVPFPRAKWCTNPGHQVIWASKFCMLGPTVLLVLRTDLSSYRPSGA